MHYMNEKYAAQKHAEDIELAAKARLAAEVPRRPNRLLAAFRKWLRKEG